LKRQQCCCCRLWLPLPLLTGLLSAEFRPPLLVLLLLLLLNPAGLWLLNPALGQHLLR
jgi:hypothetical protein